MNQYTEIRQALVAGGLRTIAYDFDGAGDSGSLGSMLLPQEFPTPAMKDLIGMNTVEDVFESAQKWGELADGKYGYQTKPSAEPALALIASIPGADDAIRDMMYSALEHFDGDWVNNDGGYGAVAIDLLTGEFQIDGFQRYTDSTDADSSGSFIEALGNVEAQAATELDLTAILKSTLNS